MYNRDGFLLLLSRAYIEPQPFFLVVLHSQCRGWGCTERWERTQLGQHSKGSEEYSISYGIIVHMVYLREERAIGNHLVWWHLSSQVTVICDRVLGWWLNSWLPVGSREWIPCFTLLLCMAFVFPFKLSASQCMSFSTFPPPIPVLTEPAERKLCGASLLAGFKTLHAALYLWL